MKPTNEWNRVIYRLWAPVYDQSVNRFFLPGRRRAIELLDLQPGERVLLVGVGMGADLPLLPDGACGTGIDLSPDMLAKARIRAARCRSAIGLVRGDAQAAPLKKAGFDAAILHLILSVVPDANACLRSTLRALKPGARLVVFDKFLPEGVNPSPLRRLMNAFTITFGTDINRRLGDILDGCPCTLELNKPSIGGGVYRIVMIRKTAV